MTEYWRFDVTRTGNNPGLAGDRLVDGEYQSVPINASPDGRLRGYSAILNLILEWQNGKLHWIEPETETPIATLEQERKRRLAERERRLAAEARTRELEEELCRPTEEYPGTARPVRAPSLRPTPTKLSKTHSTTRTTRTEFCTAPATR